MCIFVGLPARHVPVSGSLQGRRPEFAPRFANFVLGYAADSDEAIDRRVFMLRDGRLVLSTRSCRPDGLTAGQSADGGEGALEGGQHVARVEDEGHALQG